jgi:hypothetical protein
MLSEERPVAGLALPPTNVASAGCCLGTMQGTGRQQILDLWTICLMGLWEVPIDKLEQLGSVVVLGVPSDAETLAGLKLPGAGEGMQLDPSKIELGGVRVKVQCVPGFSPLEDGALVALARLPRPADGATPGQAAEEALQVSRHPATKCYQELQQSYRPVLGCKAELPHLS